MIDQPGYPPARVLRGLSLRRRIGYVLVGLGALAGSVMIGVLWATEPTPLPARTQLAFAALIAVGTGWAGFAGWALVRRPLFAVDRVIAAVLAVVFSALSTIATTAVAWARASTAGALAAMGIGLALVAVAVGMLMRARADRADLLDRRRELVESFTPPPPDAETESGTESVHTFPIGPLALAIRYRQRGLNDHRLVVVALVIGVALVAGIALLLR